MKIEKGKLYYDTTSSSLFKADEDGYNHNGFASDKIAVHCPTKEDWDYVKLFYKNILSTTSDHYYPDVNVRLDRDNSFDKRRYIEGYHIITIEEFKKFYPDDVPDPEKKQDAVNPSHYTSKGIQPIDYIEANGLNFNEGNLIKYVSRYKEKNGLEDLKKAKYYLERLIKGYESKTF